MYVDRLVVVLCVDEKVETVGLSELLNLWTRTYLLELTLVRVPGHIYIYIYIYIYI